MRWLQRLWGSDSDAGQAAPPDLTATVGAGDHTWGPEDAKITLVEYGDYACPTCRRVFPLVRELRQHFRSELRFVFRHFPLVEEHPRAIPAAEAVEAAGAQGQYWAMHDMLFRNQHALEDADLRRYARELGLDMAQFERDLHEHRFRAKVDADRQSGLASGVRGTPTFFINGARYDQPLDYETLAGELEQVRRRRRGAT